MDKRKIIFLSPVEYIKGGAERSLFDLTENPDITPILFAPAQGPILKKGTELGYETAILPFGSIRNIHRPFSFFKGLTALKDLWSAAKQLKSEGKSRNANIVHSNGLKAHMINCVSACIGGPKAVLHIRDIPYTKSEKIIWHIMLSLSNAIIVVSKACWPQGNVPLKVHVIHNGTEIPEKIRGDKPFESVINIGFIGRVHPAKGLHLLLDWIAAAKKQNIRLKLIIRGSYSDDAPEYEHQINTQSADLHLKDQIDFQGYISEPSKIYEDLDIVCVPSHVPDPLPRSVMEAMASGLPVLGYPAGGIPDMIDHGQTGYLVANKHDFTMALSELQNDETHKANIINAARSKIKSHFTIEQLHQNVSALYDKIMSQ